MRKALLHAAFTAAVLSDLPGNAQWSDTTRARDIQDKAKFILNLDVRRQQVHGDIVRFFGLRAGVQERYNIYALGLYGLGQPFIDSGVDLEDVGQEDADVRTDYGSFGATYERILFDTRHWQMSVPFMVGIGEVAVDYKDKLSDTWSPYRRSRVYPLETGLRGSFKVLFWLYIQGGVGYRKITGPDHVVNETYTGATWSYGLSIKFGKIYRYAKDKLEERRERNDTEDGTH